MQNKYTSTRNDKVAIDAKAAIYKGFSDDKGLFVLPNLKDIKINIDNLQTQSYGEIAYQILKVLLPDFSAEEIKASIQGAYHDSFDDDKITPLKKVADFHILELFHGPTSAFKDVGLQMLPQLMNRVINDEERVMILTATSGDTGTAALKGFKDINNVGISVFYPENGVSNIQEKQMYTTFGKNTNVTAISGNFDDAQTNVKKLFNDETLKQAIGKNVSLSSANSINIGRLIPQIVYYFDAYKQLLQNGDIKNGQKVNFTVPTGNFGNVLAGYYAKLMGLPINKLIIACNQNNVIADFFNHGVYDRNRDFIKTLAPSMDIQISSNFERLLYYKSNGNADYVKSIMQNLETTGRMQVEPDILASIKDDFYCNYCSDEDIKKEIRTVFDQYGYLMDPHTAVGYKVMREYQKSDDQHLNILLSTASPYKFIQAVSKALGLSGGSSDQESIQNIHAKTGFPIPTNIENLWKQTSQRPSHIAVKDMKKYVENNVKELWK